MTTALAGSAPSGACRVLCSIAASVASGAQSLPLEQRIARISELAALFEDAPLSLFLSPEAAPALGFVLHSLLGVCSEERASIALRRVALGAVSSLVCASAKAYDRFVALSCTFGRESTESLVDNAVAALESISCGSGAQKSTEKQQTVPSFLESVAPGVLAGLLPHLPASASAAQAVFAVLDSSMDRIAREGRAGQVCLRIAAASRLADATCAAHMLSVVHSALRLSRNDTPETTNSLLDSYAHMLAVLSANATCNTVATDDIRQASHWLALKPESCHTHVESLSWLAACAQDRLREHCVHIEQALAVQNARGVFAREKATVSLVHVLHGLALVSRGCVCCSWKDPASLLLSRELIVAFAEIATGPCSEELCGALSALFADLGCSAFTAMDEAHVSARLWTLAQVLKRPVYLNDGLVLAESLVDVLDNNNLSASDEMRWASAACALGTACPDTVSYLVAPLLSLMGPLRVEVSHAAETALCRITGMSEVHAAIAPLRERALDAIVRQLKHPVLYPRAPQALSQLVRTMFLSQSPDTPNDLWRPDVVLADAVGELVERAADFQRHAGYSILLLNALADCCKVLARHRFTLPRVLPKGQCDSPDSDQTCSKDDQEGPEKVHPEADALRLADATGRLAVHFVAHDADRVRLAALSCLEAVFMAFSSGQPESLHVDSVSSPSAAAQSCTEKDAVCENDTLLPLIHETWRPISARIAQDANGAVAEAALRVLVCQTQRAGAAHFMRDRVERELLGRPDGCMSLLLRPGSRPALVLDSIVSLIAAVGVRPSSGVVRRLAGAIIDAVDDSRDGQECFSSVALPARPLDSLDLCATKPDSGPAMLSENDQHLVVPRVKPLLSECLRMLQELARVDADQVWFSLAVERCGKTRIVCGVETGPWKTRAPSVAQQRLIDAYLATGR